LAYHTNLKLVKVFFFSCNFKIPKTFMCRIDTCKKMPTWMESSWIPVL